MAQLSSAINFARAQAQTDSNGLTDANAIIFANNALLDFRRQLINAGVDAAQIQEAYTDGVASTGMYLYPTDMFWLKAIELNYTDATQANYKVATALDISNIPADKSFGWLRQNANPTTPYFNGHGDWFEIFPTPTQNVSQLIRIVYFLQPTEFVATTDTISYPESLDYRILGWFIASSYLYSIGASVGSGRNVHLLGDTFNTKYQEIVKQLIETLARPSQQPVQAVPVQISGWEF